MSNQGLVERPKRKIAFDQWWALTIHNGLIPRNNQALAREAYYAAWGGSDSVARTQLDRELADKDAVLATLTQELAEARARVEQLDAYVVRCVPTDEITVFMDRALAAEADNARLRAITDDMVERACIARCWFRTQNAGLSADELEGLTPESVWADANDDAEDGQDIHAKIRAEVRATLSAALSGSASPAAGEVELSAVEMRAAAKRVALDLPMGPRNHPEAIAEAIDALPLTKPEGK